MKRADSEWHGLLAAALLSAGSAALALTAGNAHLAHSQAELDLAQRQLSAAHRALAGARAEQAALPVWLARYRQSCAQGLIADTLPDPRPQLESWRLRLTDFRYTVSAAQPQAPSGHFRPTLQTLTFQFSARHEGELLALLEALRTGSGLTLNQCRLTRRDTGLHAECSGQWLRLQRIAP